MTEENATHNEAVKLAVKLIKMPGIEGCELRAYPDPASPLYKELVKHGMLNKFLQGKINIPDYMLKDFDGKPWTIGYGETSGVKYGDVWTQEQADERLEKRVREFMSGVFKACPQLRKEPPQRIAACTSLAYNIGLGNFAKSSVCKFTMAQDYDAAAESFGPWNKAKGKEMTGLTKRRKIESDLYRSARNL